MLTARTLASLFSTAAMILGAGIASGQAYPNKSIRILCSEAGSGTDAVVRLMAPMLSANLGQQVVIDNRPVIISIELALKAPADGYNLLISGPITWLLPFMRDTVPWEPLKDFAPLTLVASSPSVVVTHPSLPVKSIKELIALAKARPGELN